MLPRAAFAIFLATVCRVSAQEALYRRSARSACRDCTASSHQAHGSICVKRCRVIQNRKRPQPGSKRSRFYPANSPKAVRASKSVFRIRVTQPGPDYRDPFLPIVLRRQTESAAGISGVGRIRQPHFALGHTRRWNESAQLGFGHHPDDRRLRDRYRSSRRRKDNSRSVSRLDDSPVRSFIR